MMLHGIGLTKSSTGLTDVQVILKSMTQQRNIAEHSSTVPQEFAIHMELL